MVVGGIEELLELRVGHRILIDLERLDVHRMLVEPARRILPWILHVDADVVEAFDLNAFAL